MFGTIIWLIFLLAFNGGLVYWYKANKDKNNDGGYADVFMFFILLIIAIIADISTMSVLIFR